MVAVTSALSLQFELNSTAGDVIWLVGSGVVALATAFFTARWWQPIYFAASMITLLPFGPEDQTIGEAFEELVQGALIAGGLVAVGVLLRFAHMARSQRLRPDGSGISSLPRGTRTQGDAAAEEVAIAGTSSTATLRSPVAVAVLCLVTLWIYAFFWWYYANRELADYGRAKGTAGLGDSPGNSTLALVPGGLLIVPALWTIVTTFRRVQAAQRLAGQPPLNGWVGLLLVVSPPAYCAYMQSGLNSVWRSQAVTPAPAPLPEPEPA